MWFTSKQREVEIQLEAYREQCAVCLRLFSRSLEHYCDTDDFQQLEQDLVKVHHTESQADDIRRSIEVMMYAKALFPESRGDVLGLLETLDTIPNQAETAIRSIATQYIHIPRSLHARVRELVHICSRCVDVALEGAAMLFTDFANAATTIGRIDELESQSDVIEANLIRSIFADAEIDALNKMLLRDLVREISAICDMAEDVSDRIRIIVAKRLT